MIISNRHSTPAVRESVRGSGAGARRRKGFSMTAVAMEFVAESAGVAREGRRVEKRHLVALPGEGGGVCAEDVAEVPELRVVTQSAGAAGWHVTDRGWAVILALLGLLMVAGVVCVGATFLHVTA